MRPETGRSDAWKNEENPSWDELDREILKEDWKISIHEGAGRTAFQHAAQRKIADALHGVAREFQNSLRKEFEDHEKYPLLSEDMKRYLRDKKHDIPSFDIYGPGTIKELQEAVSINLESGNPDVNVVVFNFPKPLAHFWWKQHGADEKRKPSKNTDWGEAYEALLPLIWEKYREAFAKENLSTDRLNWPGQHDPKHYYYIWELSEKRAPLHHLKQEDRNGKAA